MSVSVKALLVIGLGGMLFYVSPLYKGGQRGVSVATITLPDGFVVQAEVADTLERQYQGLSGRTSLAPNDGMLFVYHDPVVAPGYVMRDMLIPIDILWISEGRLVGLDESLQPEDPVVNVYRPKEPVDRVLEVSEGFAQAHGLKVGDALDIRRERR